MSDSSSPKQVCAVIVTHQPDMLFFERIEAIIAQCGHVVIVDNGSDAAIRDRLTALATSHHTLSLILHEENNLARAQNLGIAKAKALQCSFVLLLDDDSRPEPNMLSLLLQTYDVAIDRERIGMVAPHMIDTNTRRQTRYMRTALGIGFMLERAREGRVISGALNVIASGSLIPLRVLDAVGGMDESYVIDYVDREFCLRLNAKGYRTLVACDAWLYHSIGSCEDFTIAGARITATNHGALRRYYIYRNRLRTCGRYLFSVPSFVLYDVLAMGYDLLRIVCFEQDRRQKLRAMAMGAMDAIRGVSGHISAQRAHFGQPGEANG